MCKFLVGRGGLERNRVHSKRASHGFDGFFTEIPSHAGKGVCYTEHLSLIHIFSPRPGQGPGLSPATVRGIHAALHQALQAAADQCLIPNNPAKQVDPPKITHKPMKILNEEQMDTFLAAVDGNEIWRDFFYTELTTGLRLGEICGLMWSCLLYPSRCV